MKVIVDICIFVVEGGIQKSSGTNFDEPWDTVSTLNEHNNFLVMSKSKT